MIYSIIRDSLRAASGKAGKSAVKKLWEKTNWIVATVLGSTIFSLGFALFLEKNHINSGGISGLAMAVVKLLGIGSVGTLSMLINFPLFLLGGKKIGKQFFFGSLLGLVLSSVLIDAFSLIPFQAPETMVSAIYGGAICGLGLGIVFAAGTSTGGSDILIRLLKLRWRDVPIGQISLVIDVAVVVLTGIVFNDVSKALYSGIAVFLTSQVLDVVVYRFDYSKIAFIVSPKYQQIAESIGIKLNRGATFLDGEGSYSHSQTKVVLTVVKKRQLAELKELVMDLDPNAFVIVQEAHQVLGDGFSRYSRNSL